MYKNNFQMKMSTVDEDEKKMLTNKLLDNNVVDVLCILAHNFGIKHFPLDNINWLELFFSSNF